MKFSFPLLELRGQSKVKKGGKKEEQGIISLLGSSCFIHFKSRRVPLCLSKNWSLLWGEEFGYKSRIPRIQIRDLKSMLKSFSRLDEVRRVRWIYWWASSSLSKLNLNWNFVFERGRGREGGSQVNETVGNYQLYFWCKWFLVGGRGRGAKV